MRIFKGEWLKMLRVCSYTQIILNIFSGTFGQKKTTIALAWKVCLYPTLNTYHFLLMPIVKVEILKTGK